MPCASRTRGWDHRWKAKEQQRRNRRTRDTRQRQTLPAGDGERGSQVSAHFPSAAWRRRPAAVYVPAFIRRTEYRANHLPESASTRHRIDIRFPCSRFDAPSFRSWNSFRLMSAADRAIVRTPQAHRKPLTTRTSSTLHNAFEFILTLSALVLDPSGPTPPFRIRYISLAFSDDAS